jgi:hypothetical protein
MDAEVGDSLPPVTRYWDAGAAFNCEFEYAPAKERLIRIVVSLQ